MGKNYMRLNIGGEDRGLKFNLGTLKNIQELTNNDPFNFFISGPIDKQIEQISVLLYASLLANCRSQKKEPDFTQEDCMLWAEDMDLKDAEAMMHAFGEAYKAPASQEGGKDTQGADVG
jgi:hypothetical protein